MAYSPQDVYARHLVSRRGYPLWTPEPNMNLPDVYIREGLKIGDVGIVVPRDGSFDVFFNICLPDDHPLHRETGVPDNFTHIPLRGRDVVTFPVAESAGRIISTSSVVRVRNKHVPEEDVEGRAQPGPLNYEFTLSSCEGAVLILPEGAEHHYLHNEHAFRGEAIRHAVDWYAFAEQRLGRIINHDSLYLITGFYKARSWSLAAYQQSGGAAEASAQFKAVQVGRGGIAANYTWETTNAMDWRVGPPDLYYYGTANQSVFIEGFKIAVRETALLRKQRVKVTAGFPSVQKYRGDFSSSSRGSNLWGLGGRSMKGSGSAANAQASGDVGTDATESDPLADGTDSSEDIIVQRFPQVADPFHPSDIINQYLLDKVPSATVAITHDTQWTKLLEKGLFDPEELSHEGRLKDVISNYKVRTTKGGAVYLKSQSKTTKNDGDGSHQKRTTENDTTAVQKSLKSIKHQKRATKNDTTVVQRQLDTMASLQSALTALIAADREDSDTKDNLIAAMGPTGSRKSTHPNRSRLVSLYSLMRTSSEKPILFDLKLSTTSFLNSDATDSYSNKPFYTVETISSYTTVWRLGLGPRDGLAEIAYIHWPKERGEDNAEIATVQMDGDYWKETADFAFSRKFHVPYHQHALEWKKNGNAYVCSTQSCKGAVATIGPFDNTGTLPILKVFESLTGSHLPHPNHAGIPLVLLDYLFITALLLVTEPDGWLNLACNPPETDPSISSESACSSPASFRFLPTASYDAPSLRSQSVVPGFVSTVAQAGPSTSNDRATRDRVEDDIIKWVRNVSRARRHSVDGDEEDPFAPPEAVSPPRDASEQDSL